MSFTTTVIKAFPQNDVALLFANFANACQLSGTSHESRILSFCHWRASKFAKIVQPKPKAGYQPSFMLLQKSWARKKFLFPLTAFDTILTPLPCLTGSAVDCSLCAQTIASDSKSSETVVIAKEVGVSAEDFSWPFMEQFALEHCICASVPGYHDVSRLNFGCLFAADQHPRCPLTSCVEASHVFEIPFEAGASGEYLSHKMQHGAVAPTRCCLQGPTVWTWMVQFPCNSAHGAADLAWMQKVQVLHCVDCHTCECLPFFFHPKSIQRWIRFYKRAETFRIACQINLGKPSGRKTPTGPVEYLGHASTESQAEEEMFEGNFFLTVYSWCSRDAPRCSPGGSGCFAMSFDFLLIPMPTALYLCLHHSCRCCSAAWGCEAFELPSRNSNTKKESSFASLGWSSEGKSAVAHVPSKRPAIGSTSKHTQPPRR